MSLLVEFIYMEKLRAKKSLGQNFLKEEAVLRKIVEAAKISGNDVVIEIGPGQGSLTKKLAEICKKVIAIEIDDRLVPILQKKFKDISNVEIIHEDILKINLPKLLITNNLQFTTYKVVANIPYYITAPIIRLLLETKYPAKEIILMVQKEVAERIVAQKGEMSILAVSVQYYAAAEVLFTVSRSAFDPAPEIDSAVIRIIKNNKQEKITKEETKKFFRIVKAGFSAKRKTLVNNLSNSLQFDKKKIEDKLLSIGFMANTRAQEMGVEDWQKLTDLL